MSAVGYDAFGDVALSGAGAEARVEHPLGHVISFDQAPKR